MNDTKPKVYPEWHPMHDRMQAMSLRDYFAAKAMEALMTSDKYGGIVGINNYEHNRAKDAYMVADAMLKARNQ